MQLSKFKPLKASPIPHSAEAELWLDFRSQEAVVGKHGGTSSQMPNQNKSINNNQNQVVCVCVCVSYCVHDLYFSLLPD